MLIINQLRFFFVSQIIYVASSLTSMRMTHIRILRQSVYSHGFYRHFLGKFSGSSMKDCLWMCHNNVICMNNVVMLEPFHQQSRIQLYLLSIYVQVALPIKNQVRFVLVRKEKMYWYRRWWMDFNSVGFALVVGEC